MSRTPNHKICPVSSAFSHCQFLLLSVVLTLFLFAGETSAQTNSLSWPQWRGPSRDGHAPSGTQWPKSIGETSLKNSWKIALGPSYSGPVVSNSLVFTTETINQSHEVVRAIDRKTGELKWEKKWEGAMKVPFFARANGDWIRCTPTYDGKYLYVGGIRDVLVCLAAESGEEAWRVDFVQETGAPLPSFGFVCSPLVTDRHVYVQAGGGLCKLDKTDGNIIWRKLSDGGGMYGSAFSSPILATVAGKRQLLVQTRENLVGIDPDDGDTLWSVKIPTFRGMNILTPTFYGDSVFTSAYGGSTKMITIRKNGLSFETDEKWTNRVTGYMSSPVVIGKHVYLHLRNQRFTCIDLETGQTRWTSKPYGKYWSLVANNDRILALDERGDLLLINATPEKFDLLESRHISDEPTWAHLAVSDDQIFVRELKALTCYQWMPTETEVTQK